MISIKNLFKRIILILCCLGVSEAFAERLVTETYLGVSQKKSSIKARKDISLL